MKKIITLVLVVFVLFTLTIPVYAANETSAVESINSEDNVIARAEVTEWHFRTNPITGKGEMRLWSITYGYWITDWIAIP